MVIGKVETGGLRQEVGRRFREARLNVGLTQVNMAADIGMPSTYLSEVETGKRNITLRTLAGIASFLGLDVKVKLVPKPTGKRAARRQGTRPVT
jgi:transcriptional regulator with XRE-family HTH domain